MQPESSDGFASVGTILPKGKAALLPGGFFVPESPFRSAMWVKVDRKSVTLVCGGMRFELTDASESADGGDVEPYRSAG